MNWYNASLAGDLSRAGQAGASAINTGFARPGSGTQLGTLGEAKKSPTGGVNAPEKEPTPDKNSADGKILGMKKDVFIVLCVFAGVLIAVGAVFVVLKIKTGKNG